MLVSGIFGFECNQKYEWEILQLQRQKQIQGNARSYRRPRSITLEKNKRNSLIGPIAPPKVLEKQQLIRRVLYVESIVCPGILSGKCLRM